MKKLVVIALFSVLLAGCVKQEDYDDLYKENVKLEKKIERLEADKSILENESNSMTNVYECNGDEVSYSIAESNGKPIPTITYTLSKNVDLKEQEQRITFFWAYCFNSLANINSFTFIASGSDYCMATYQKVAGENVWSGTDRNGEFVSISPDWMLEWGKTKTELPIDSNTKEWLKAVSEQIGNDCKLRQDY